jgi:hypothetical protein
VLLLLLLLHLLMELLQQQLSVDSNSRYVGRVPVPVE